MINYLTIAILVLLFPFAVNSQDTLNLKGDFRFHNFANQLKESQKNGYEKSYLYKRISHSNIAMGSTPLKDFEGSFSLWENKNIFNIHMEFRDLENSNKLIKFYENGLPSLVATNYALYNYLSKSSYFEHYVVAYVFIGSFSKYHENGFLYSIEEIDTTGLVKGVYYDSRGKLLRTCECKDGKPQNGICFKFVRLKSIYEKEYVLTKFKDGKEKKQFIIDEDLRIVKNKILPKFLNRWLYRDILEAYFLSYKFHSFFGAEDFPINNEESKHIDYSFN